MDKWDPLLVNSLAKHRPLILVDHPGIGKSTGRVAPSFRQSAEDIIEFLGLLKITEVDILGFSIGAFVAQMVALNRDPKVLKVRHLIIAGSSASVGPDMPATTNDYVTHATAGKLEVDHFKMLFFPKNAEGDAAAEAYWERLKERNMETSREEPADWASQDPIDCGAAMQTQGQAYAAFLTAETSQGVEGSYGRLYELDMPVLVAQGSVSCIPGFAYYPGRWMLTVTGRLHVPNDQQLRLPAESEEGDVACVPQLRTRLPLPVCGGRG